MSSQIVAIYDALAATTITVDNKAIRVKDADELPNSLSSADLPVRLLTPFSEFLPENAATQNLLFDSSTMVQRIDWSLADIMFWRPVAQGVGVKAVAGLALVYMRQYFAMWSALSVPGTVEARLRMQASAALEYPQFSGNYYYGVVAILSLAEKV